MKHTIKDDCTHAYVGIVLLVTIFMVLFVVAVHGQELPNAPQAAAVKQQIPPTHKQGLLLAKPGNRVLLLVRIAWLFEDQVDLRNFKSSHRDVKLAAIKGD